MRVWYLYGSPERYKNYVDAFCGRDARVCATELVSRARLCDALLLAGGGDIHPKRYAAALHGARDIDEVRDTAELALVDDFLARRRPVIGICRGLQIINVAFGGTLRQHIDGHSRIDGRDRIHLTHTEDDLLRELYGEEFFVNSAHHQAVETLGRGLHAVQWAQDGTVEALRHETLPVFAVQWHPERLQAEVGTKSTVDGGQLIEALCRWAEKA